MKKEKHMIYIEADVWKRLEALSEKEGKSISFLISQMVQVSLEKLENRTVRSTLAG